MKFKGLFLLNCLFFLLPIYCWAQLPSLTFGNSGNASGCAPHTVVFNITNASTNTSNTVYSIDFGDGTPVINYTQATIPSSFSHLYTTISCGETFGGLSNCFGATLTATNSSGQTIVTVAPIRISKKPNASFIQSASSVCSGNSIIFTNISDPGVTYTGATCNISPSYYWAVTGSSVGTVTSGTLGSNGTFPTTINAWTTGSSPLSMQFNTPGTYQMKLSIGNSCGIDDTTLNFEVVNSSPSLSVGSPGNTEQCAPVTLDLSISNFENNSISTTYTITFNDGSESQIFSHPPPAIVSHTFTESSCGQTTFSGLPDAFWVQITAQNTCGIAIAVIEAIRIGSLPIADFSELPTSICTNNPNTVISTAESGTIVNFSGCNTNHAMVWSIMPAIGWNVSSGSLGSTNEQPNNYMSWTSGSEQFSIIFSIPGAYTITQRIRNSCGEDLVSQTVAVVAVATANAGPDQSICLNSAPINLTGTPIGGTWSGVAWVSTSGIFSPISVGPDTLTYTIGAGTCIATDQKIVAVHALPEVSFELEDTLFCNSDAPITLTTGVPEGGVYFGSGVSGNVFDPHSASLGVSTLVYTYDDLNGCSNSATSTIALEICASIENIIENKTFKIYPNPSSGLLNILVEPEFTYSEVTIFTIDGKMIFHKKLHASASSFDFCFMPAGAYMICCRNTAEIITLPWYKFN